MSQKILNTKKSKDIIIPENNNILNWRQVIQKEFFVDFETYNNGEIIYMIGVGFNFRGMWEYHNFIIDYIEDIEDIEDKVIKNDGDLIEKFIEFILSFKEEKEEIEEYYKNIRLWHYGHAEASCYNKLLKKLNIKELSNKYNLSIKKYDLPWYDLNRVIKGDMKTPIIIKNIMV